MAGVLSSVGGGVLTGVIVSAVDRLRRRTDGKTATQGDVEQEIARQIQDALAAGDAAAQALHPELAAVLREIDAGGTALRQALDTGNEQVRSDVVAAIGALSAGFAGLQFLLGDIYSAAGVSSDGLSTVAFRPGGRILAVGDGDSTVQLWDAATRREAGRPLTLNVTGGILEFSPDGKMLAASSGDSVRLVNIATGRLASPPLVAGEGVAGRIRSFAYSPDGRTLATVTSDAAQLWDTATYRRIGTFRIGQPFVPGDSYKTVDAVAFSPSGKSLAVAISDTVHFWDMTTRRQIGAPLNMDFPPPLWPSARMGRSSRPGASPARQCGNSAAVSRLARP